MIFEVLAGPRSVDFAPSTVEEEIIQNVATILSTLRYTVPFDRGFGVNPTYLDDPMPAGRARVTADVIRAIQRYEPRCKVESVVFDADQGEGVLIPKVRVSIV